VQAVSVKPGQGVEPGQVMLTLDSPELRHQLGLAQARAQQLAWQVEQQAFDARLQEQGATLRQRRDAAREELAGVQALVAQLQLRAAFSGKVVSLDPSQLPGEWVPRGERLVQIASPQGVKVEAYVSEDALPRISVGSTARFVADEPGQPHIDCAVDSIDRIAIIELDQPALASPFGGPIAASVNKSGVVAPRDAHFRVRLNQCQGIAHTPRERIGSVVIGRAYRSFAGEWLRHLAAAVQRDAGL
jgi:putative peptide zinc metalloprotease protein